MSSCFQISTQYCVIVLIIDTYMLYIKLCLTVFKDDNFTDSLA